MIGTISLFENEVLWVLWLILLYSMERGDSHEHDGLRFSLRPPQVSGDSSEVGTVDVQTSICSVGTVWPTKYCDPLWKVEILTNNLVFSVVLYGPPQVS